MVAVSIRKSIPCHRASLPAVQDMMEYAKQKGVPVYMGYNKNVTPYVLKVHVLTDQMCRQMDVSHFLLMWPRALAARWHVSRHVGRRLPVCQS